MKREILRMENITTYSGGVKILDHAKMNLFEREILGIVGLNYCGKSALLGGINGYLPYTEGTTYYFEEKIRIMSVADARKKGVFYIQPKTSFISGFTVAENMYLKEQGNRSFFCDKRRHKKECQVILEKMSVNLSPEMLVDELTYSEKVMAEVCNAVANKAKVLIFDGVLSAMAKNLSTIFSNMFQTLLQHNISIVLAEPSFGALKFYCDRLLVLRKGCTVGEMAADEIEENKVISYMLGHPLGDSISQIVNRRRAKDETILSFDNIYAEHTLRGVSFRIYRNEITGVLNFNKNSGSVIEDLLCGNQKPESGQLLWNGREMLLNSTNDAIRNHIAVVGEEDSLCDALSLQENVIMSAIVKGSRYMGLVRGQDYKYIKNQVMEEYFTGYDTEIKEDEPLPEGWFWRKKVAFCRALATEPELVVMVNPTQYIDMVSKREIQDDIISLKKKNISVLVVSADIEEIVHVCDRMVVVQSGEVVEDFEIDKANIQRIMDKYGAFLKMW